VRWADVQTGNPGRAHTFYGPQKQLQDVVAACCRFLHVGKHGWHKYKVRALCGGLQLAHVDAEDDLSLAGGAWPAQAY